jgi:serine/threonine protein kinase
VAVIADREAGPLDELLGRGGMGEVWRAYDPTMDRVVALKVLPEGFTTDKVFQERFRREARAAAGLDEPHVVPFVDLGEVDGIANQISADQDRQGAKPDSVTCTSDLTGQFSCTVDSQPTS